MTLRAYYISKLQKTRDAKSFNKMSTAAPKSVVPPTESLAKMTVDAKAPSQTAAPTTVSNTIKPAEKSPGCKLC
jgi:hypothetical protein